MLGAGAGKRRQVDAFLRVLQGAVEEADLPTDRPLRVVDLGCGNAYLTFAAYRFLADHHDVHLTGIDQRPEMRERNTALAAELGWAGQMSFVAGNIIDAPLPDGEVVDVVLALHACDTATDDALAQAARWAAPVVLASPCCHHDLQRQMSAGPAPAPYGLVARHAILRERLGDVLTDAVRAALLRRIGYRVEVVQFVSAEYTPRNTMIRAVRTTGARPDPAADAEYDELVRRLGRHAVPADAARRRPCRSLVRSRRSRPPRCCWPADRGPDGRPDAARSRADRVQRARGVGPARRTCCGRTPTAARLPRSSPSTRTATPSRT